MLNKSILLFSLVIISIAHLSAFVLYAPELKKVVVTEKSSAPVISLRKVTLKKKEVKKVEPIVKKVKKVKPIKKVKKIVKKAKRKVPKKTKKPVKKIVKKPIEKPIKKVVQKPSPKVQPKLTAKVQKVSKKVVVSVAKKQSIRNEYLLKLRKRIEQNKVYPKRAKRLRQEGKVLVSFLIQKNGKIQNISLKGKSSYKRLDKAALELLKKIARFDPIPKELGKDSWAIEVPINYSIINI